MGVSWPHKAGQRAPGEPLWAPPFRWQGVEEAATIECHNFGPLLDYARFANARLLRQTLAEDAQSSPYCIAGREFVSAADYARGPFVDLCNAIQGRLVIPRGADFIPFEGPA